MLNALDRHLYTTVSIVLIPSELSSSITRPHWSLCWFLFSENKMPGCLFACLLVFWGKMPAEVKMTSDFWQQQRIKDEEGKGSFRPQCRANAWERRRKELWTSGQFWISLSHPAPQEGLKRRLPAKVSCIRQKRPHACMHLCPCWSPTGRSQRIPQRIQRHRSWKLSVTAPSHHSANTCQPPFLCQALCVLNDGNTAPGSPGIPCNCRTGCSVSSCHQFEGRCPSLECVIDSFEQDWATSGAEKNGSR